MESESDDSTSTVSTERNEGHEGDTPVTASARTPNGRQRAVTARWQVGRLVRVSIEAGCGFIRPASGELIYFAMDDVVASTSGDLRAGSRVRFQQVGAGVPRALSVQRV